MVDDSGNSEPRLLNISANEILYKIQKGEPVEYDHAIINDDLDACKLDPQKGNYKYIIKSSIKIRNSIVKGHVDFENVLFDKSVDFSLCKIEGVSNFSGAIFKIHATFLATKFKGGALFKHTIFCESVNFVKAEFNDKPPYPPFPIPFEDSKFNRDCFFSGSSFNGEARFLDCRFDNKAEFNEVQFLEGANFIRAVFRNDVYFIGARFSGNVYFVQAKFNEIAHFLGSQFDGEVLTFKDTKFSIPIDQEDACRKAKNVMERSGDREKADYHFYREMDGKRKQKPRYIRYPEWFFIQFILGYGVHPFRLMFCWFLVAIIFAFFYSANGGIISKLPASTLPQPLSYFVECSYFSIVTAVTPGYGKYELASWIYQVIASIEAIFGTFMWAAVIATFSRKYMR